MAEPACPLCGELASAHVAGQQCPAPVPAKPKPALRPPVRVLLTVRQQTSREALFPAAHYLFDLVGACDQFRLPHSIELTDQEWRFIRRHLRNERKYSELLEELRNRKKGV